MKDIVFTLELYDDAANSCANDYLEKGWQLLHVGTKVIGTYNEQFYYNTVYVVGANSKQYDEYKRELPDNDFDI
ncbi:hypothetical protein PDQ34_26010 [Bacillus cereus]|nr:hypothetical protein [Bacillus cereus]MDA2572667.1 hypothetical protein [Bacillus cereus]